MEPNLWIPGKKPIGPVKIDWNHPLTKGLAAAYIFRANEPAAVDLVTGAVTKYHSSMGASPEGVDLTSVTNVTDIPVPKGLAGNDKFTFMFRARHTQTATALSNTIFSYRNDSSITGLLVVYPWDESNGDGIRIYYDADWRLNENIDAIHIDQLVHDFTIVGHTGSATLVAYIDSTKTIMGYDANNTLTTTPTAMSIGGWRGTTQLITPSYLHHLYVYDHNLDEVPIRDMHIDPYQFLIPA